MIRILKRVCATVLAGAVALGAAGCSSSQDSPEAALTAFLHAMGAQDVKAACALLAVDNKPLEDDDMTACESGFHAAVEMATPEELTQLRSARVTGSNVSGDEATVTPEQIEGVPTAYNSTVSLVRVDGTWFVVSTF